VRSGEVYGKPIAVLCAAPSVQRGVFVREALQRTLEAQGATVVFSATVSVPPSAKGSSDVSVEAANTVASALEALVSATPVPLVT